MRLYPLIDFESPRCYLLIAPSAVVLFIALLTAQLIGCSSKVSVPPAGGSLASASASGSSTIQIPYSTSFPLPENPISEGGDWINGKTTGLDWANVRTTPKLAFGTESGSGGYDDSTAVLAGTWAPDQMAQAVVHTVSQNSGIFEEVELRLRTTISAHNITGYEINFRCTSDGTQYVQIVRWNGPFGNFTYVSVATGPGLHDGDIIMANVVGSTITAYINGVQVVQGTDSTYASGNPGIGFFLEGGGSSLSADYGFTSFTALNGSTAGTTPPSTPANLSVSVISPSEIDLSWNPSTDGLAVVGYQVFRNNNQIATATIASFSDRTVVPGAQYTYAVSAFDTAGNISSRSSPVVAETSSGPDTIPPSVPANLSANVISPSEIDLSWNPSTDGVAVVGYQVFRNNNQIATTTSVSFSDKTVVASTQYTYTVYAVDAAGNISAQSSPVLAQTPPGADITPPSVPANLQSSNVTSTSLTVTWSASSDNVAVAGYQIFRNGSKVANTIATSYADTGLVGATIYVYTVAAYDTSNNNSAQSQSLSVATSGIAAETTPPSVPTGLSAAGLSSSQIILTWVGSTDPDNTPSQISYQVYRNGISVATTAAGVISWTDTGLAASTAYSYTVSASDPIGNSSAQSAPVNATTNGTPDTQAPSVNITSPSNNQMISGMATVAADAADNVAVIGVQFQLDGANLGAEATAQPYSTSWDTGQTSNGAHLLTAIARDAAGNRTTSSGITVTVSNSSLLKTYSTSFPLAENPMSENGNWINGKATGVDWTDVQTTPGLAYGTQSGSGGYDDSTAVLAGTWAPDQMAQAVVHTVNQNTGIFEEVELRLRTTITAHSITGYEINFRCTSDGTQYVQIVRWNGPFGNFTYVSVATGPGLHDGDIVMAKIVGSTITAYINGVQVVQGTDSTYASGNPGMGFFMAGGAPDINADFGFTSFTASNGLTVDTASATTTSSTATDPATTTTSSTTTDPATTTTSSTTSTSSGPQIPYSTSFPLAENPVSEGGDWINGKATGVDWADVQTTPGLAYGTQSGSGGYDDSTAVLAGTWAPDQMAQAVVHTVNQNTGIFEEVELRLRTTITAHSITGYEINFRCTSDGTQYVQIVRWNGPLGSFTGVNSANGPGLHNGDIVMAKIVGSTITAYINGVQVVQGTDSTYTSGNPGVGFFMAGGAPGINADFGFTSFAASND